MNATLDKGETAKTVAELCADRRKALPKGETLSVRPWGLALSGGGIRSATFSFGLLKALAASSMFHRFDILSTVSGGGYIGATVGKLFQNGSKGSNAVDPIVVEKALGDAEMQPYGIWLRANGRYLIPKGIKDMLFAAANFVRNLLAVHVELALLSLLLGSLLVAVDLAVWQWADCVFAGRCTNLLWIDVALLGKLSLWPPLWLLLPFMAWLGTVLACAYWVMPANQERLIKPQRLIGLVICIAGIGILLRHSTPWLDSYFNKYTGLLQLPVWLTIFVVAILLAWIFGTVVALAAALLNRQNLDLARNQLTGGLAIILTWTLIILGLGIADYLSWSLGNQDVSKHGALGVALVTSVIALRAALPKVADLPKSLTPSSRRGVLKLLSFAGLLMLALLVIFWMSFVHRATSSVLFVEKPPSLEFRAAYQWLGWIVVPLVLLVAMSWRNREFLNRSSLYTFYRARLIRSYLGAANPARFGTQNSVACSRDWANVADVSAGDDVLMAEYAPHLNGGPVHLINVCVNQTRDPLGGLFNQDRKGLLMTVGPKAQMSVFSGEWKMPSKAAKLTLGSWTAISGAAVAPGLGSSTRSGVAAVLMMAGLRLGYWWDSHGFGRDPSVHRPRIGKYCQFQSELRARFDGDKNRDWFLSDGGHFENTGAYALLREECELIVVADGGADPRYSFGDLENLLRKARIDLQVDITFLRPRAKADTLVKQLVQAESTVMDSFELAPSVFGSLSELSSEDSQACLALARIDYRISNQVGYMLIVKPNMCHGLPVDLVNFKADNALFPQEPTTDQFFGEAQWESYFQLGQILGSKVRFEDMRDAKSFAEKYFLDDDGAMQVLDQKGEPVLKYSSKRLSSRILSTGTVSASVSIGAMASIGLAAWQALSTEWNSASQNARIEPAAYKELADLFGRLPPPPLPAQGASAAATVAIQDAKLGEMATALLRIGDAVCNDANTEAFRASSVMQLIVTNTKQACLQTASRHPSCDGLLKTDLLPQCLKQASVACVKQYWTRDYGLASRLSANCWDPERAAVTQGKTEMASTTIPTPASSTVPPPRALPNQPDVCAGQTIYLQIYGPQLRDSVRILRDSWQALGASVPPIEDVWDSARRAGSRLPQPYQIPTVIYHDDDGKVCAEGLQPPGSSPAWKIQALASNFNERRGVIEVWVPPVRSSEVLPESAYCYQEDDKTPDSSKRYGVHCHLTVEACAAARGDNKRRGQSACAETKLYSGAGSITFSRGWSRSWYALQTRPFGEPFPQLPAQ